MLTQQKSFSISVFVSGASERPYCTLLENGMVYRVIIYTFIPYGYYLPSPT